MIRCVRLLRSACAALVASAAVLPIQALTFSTEGIHGAGFQNVVAISPDGSKIVAGADIAGFHLSTDAGANWKTVNHGVWYSRKVAGLAWSSDSSMLYAVTGAGSGGGFLASADDGSTWERRNSTLRFSGVSGDPGRSSPRATGKLILIDGSYFYVGTLEDGVFRSTDGGYTWTCLGLVGCNVRSMAFDPANKNILFVACDDTGSGNGKIWKAFSVRTKAETFDNTDWFQLVNAPEHSEELLGLGNTLYVVGRKTSTNVSGVWKSTDLTVNGAWTACNNGLSSSSDWISIDGYVKPTGGAHVLYVGCTAPAEVGTSGWYYSIMRSTDGGTNWTNAAPSTSVSFNIAGTTEPWFLSIDRVSYMLSKSNGVGLYYTAAQIAVSPTTKNDNVSDDVVLIAGRSGLWRTLNGGGTWNPSVRHLGVTQNRAVIADPKKAGRVYVANTDYRFFASINSMTNVDQAAPSSATMGTALALDTTKTPSDVIFAAGNRDDNTGGEVYTAAGTAFNTPGTAVSWTDTNLSAINGGNRVLGVAVGYSGSSRVLLAAVQQGTGGTGGTTGKGGIYRKVGSNAWTKLSSAAGAMGDARGGNLQAMFAWPPGAYVYFYDPMKGLFRSNNAGASGSWTLIWDKASGDGTTARTCYVAADPAVAGRVYVSRTDGVFRLANAHTATSFNTSGKTNLGGPADPGPLTLAPGGGLYCAEEITSTHDPRLWKWNAPGSSTTCSDISDAYFKSAASQTISISVGVEATPHVYVSSYEGGAILVGH